MKKELPAWAVWSIVAAAIVVVLVIGAFTVGGLGPQRVPSSEKVKPEEAAQRYQQYQQGGQSPEMAARMQRQAEPAPAPR